MYWTRLSFTDLRGAPGTCPPPRRGPNFFQFHAVFWGENWGNNNFLHPSLELAHPSSQKSRIRPWVCSISQWLSLCKQEMAAPASQFIALEAILMCSKRQFRDKLMTWNSNLINIYYRTNPPGFWIGYWSSKMDCLRIPKYTKHRRQQEKNQQHTCILKAANYSNVYNAQLKAASSAK